MSDPRETLARIRKQADAATPGPWEASSNDRSMYHVTTENEEFCAEYGPELYDSQGFFSDDDTEFIAAARTDVPWLLEQVEIRDKALEAALEMHVVAQPITAAYGTQEGGDYCVTCVEDWPCPTVTAATAPLTGEAGA